MAIAKPVPLDPEAIAIANSDLQERIFNEGVHLVYDEDGDTLFVAIGAGGRSIARPFLDDIYLDIDPETYKVRGCTILAFASDFLANNKLVRKAFPNALGALKAGGGTLDWEGPQATKFLPLFQSALPAA